MPCYNFKTASIRDSLYKYEDGPLLFLQIPLTINFPFFFPCVLVNVRAAIA